MPDPVWDWTYSTANTPEVNGFTLTADSVAGAVTAVTSGNPANRRVDIDGSIGNAIYLRTNVPALDSQFGGTFEIEAEFSGGVAGQSVLGVEATFQDAGIVLDILPDEIALSFPGGPLVITGMANGPRALYRLAFTNSRAVSVYKNGAQVGTTEVVGTVVKPARRVLWWGEGPGIKRIWAMRYYLGGGVAPG